MTRVWLTGAGKGIGRALALALARRGDVVAASARTTADLTALIDAAAGLPGRIVAFPLDVTDAAAVEASVAAIEDGIGAIDLAILNAGTHRPMTAREFDARIVRHLIETNLMGAAHGLEALLPRMLRRRAGRIAVVASVAGYRGLPTAAAYGASKAALIALCEALRPELAADGVSLSVVNPGFVRTPLTDRNDFAMPFRIEAKEAAERILQGLASGRFEITFPRRFTWGMKVLRCLPYPLFFALTRRLVRDEPAVS